MEVELLYFEGCPNVEGTRARVRAVLREEGLPAVIYETEVRGENDAERLVFLGSPSVRIDGLDVDPEVRGRSEWAFGCRVYGDAGVPPTEMPRAAVRAARGAAMQTAEVARLREEFNRHRGKVRAVALMSPT